MKIVEYEDKYLEDVRNLLVELETYLISIDKDNLDILGSEFREKMALNDLQRVKENDGKCYLIIQDGNVAALIMGIMRKYSEEDYLDYKCPKAGEIIELIVNKDCRKSGIGNILINKMEEYFISKGCEYSFLDVFAYNDPAINFYEKHNYHSRMHVDIKKLN